MIIYIIDDNETNLDLFETIVRKTDPTLEPICYIDPIEALRSCEQRMPDIVVVDYMMPGIDGHEFVKRFRALHNAEAVSVVMVTAAIERQVRRTALDLGVSDFLTKPIDPYETRARLKTLVALRRSYLKIQDHGRWLAEEVEKATRTILERERELGLGLVIADAANQAGTVSDVFRFALEKLCDFTGWELGISIFTNDDALRLNTILHDASGDGAAERSLAEAAIDPESLAGRVVATREAQWTDDFSKARVHPCELGGVDNFAASVALPVLVGTQVAAVMQFFTAGALELTESRLGLLSQVGMQLGRVIERARAEQILIHNALYDPLTRLPNRAHFAERLEQAIAIYKRDPSSCFAVLFIDLDRFKIVNDSLGHLAGDDLLIQVAARMQSCVRKSDTLTHAGPAGSEETAILARLGGDEFTMLLQNIKDPSDALRVAERIQQSLQLSFSVIGHELYMGASIGITLSSAAYQDSTSVLRDADLAMYRAKSLGKGRSEIFDQAMHNVAMARLTLETDLRHAFRNQEFILHYQPIVDLVTRQVAGFEALVRWRLPSGEIVPPNKFIPIAEETGLIVLLGEWVLREACRQLCEWDIAFPEGRRLTMSVNVSPREFNEPGFTSQVERILMETGVDARRIRLEITEGATMDDAENAIQVLSQLCAQGVKLSVDDFGIGYSSLSYLHRFPLSILKIDRSFVVNIIGKRESLDIIKSIISLARNMGLQVVAEGAEQEDQVKVLKSLGCDFVQGFIFDRPLGAAAATSLLLSRTPTGTLNINEIGQYV